MALPVPTGVDDFRELRESGLVYVDKSALLCELLDLAGAKIVLWPRPRRFGKSLNLSMLRWYFEKRDEDLLGLFEDLAVWQAGDAYRAHFQRYPVIYLSFKEAKSDSFAVCWESICNKIIDLFEAHDYLLESDPLRRAEARRYHQMLDGDATDDLYRRALGDLSRYLHRYHGEKVVILIDEYDAPIHGGYANGYAPQIIDFFQAFFSTGLKGNPHVFRGALTGILRIARESIFSDLNNLRVYSLLSPSFNTSFGFTEAEVVDVLNSAGLQDQLLEVRAWYNGYEFGGQVVYNPWSVLCFIDEASRGGMAQPHWLSSRTSANQLIKRTLEQRTREMQPAFEALLAGRDVVYPVEENVALDELRTNDDALWTLLVFAGYLNATAPERRADDRIYYRLRIPNREVRLVYTKTFRDWLTRWVGGGNNLSVLTRALLSGDGEMLEEQLQNLVLNMLSYHDTAQRDAVPPELLYHGFILGLLAVLEPAYRVRSNRESGRGRPDVMIAPNPSEGSGESGALLELKVARPGVKSLEQALDEGLAQIARREYDAELRSLGVSDIHAFAIAFDGKHVRVRTPA